MKCPRPDCGAEGRVMETRVRPDGIRRRRYVCANEHRFSTLEQIAERERYQRGLLLPLPATSHA